jgi:hypothetical protein
MAALLSADQSEQNLHQELENLLSTKKVLVAMGVNTTSIEQDIRSLCANIAQEGAGEYKQNRPPHHNNHNNHNHHNHHDSDDSDDNDDLSRAVALSLDASTSVESFVVRCMLDGCTKQCPIDADQGGSHDYCCIDHMNRAHQLAARPCGLPGCNARRADRSDYCTKNHQDRATSRGLLAPHEPDVERVYVGSTGDYTVSVLQKTYDKYDTIKNDFLSKWHKDFTPLNAPRIKRILKLSPPQHIQSRFQEYATNVGNVRRLYHGTSTSDQCRFAIDLDKRPCTNTNCCLCNICHSSLLLRFAGGGVQGSGSATMPHLRFGAGLYFSPCSGKSNDYASGSSKMVGKRFRNRPDHREEWRVMCVCEVALGKSYRTETDMQGIIEPPSGFDSISAEIGAVLNYPECIVYNEAAVCPKYLIVYAPPQ